MISFLFLLFTLLLGHSESQSLKFKNIHEKIDYSQRFGDLSFLKDSKPFENLRLLPWETLDTFPSSLNISTECLEDLAIIGIAAANTSAVSEDLANVFEQSELNLGKFELFCRVSSFSKFIYNLIKSLKILKLLNKQWYAVRTSYM